MYVCVFKGVCIGFGLNLFDLWWELDRCAEAINGAVSSDGAGDHILKISINGKFPRKVGWGYICFRYF